MAEVRITADLVQRLAWLYGVETAKRIISGQDAPTNHDIVKWRNLGLPKQPKGGQPEVVSKMTKPPGVVYPDGF